MGATGPGDAFCRIPVTLQFPSGSEELITFRIELISSLKPNLPKARLQIDVETRRLCSRLQRGRWEPCVCQHNSATFSLAPACAPFCTLAFQGQEHERRSSTGHHMTGREITVICRRNSLLPSQAVSMANRSTRAAGRCLPAGPGGDKGAVC